MRMRSPTRVARKHQCMAIAAAMPSKNSGQTSSALRTCGLSDQKPNGMPGSSGALGCT